MPPAPEAQRSGVAIVDEGSVVAGGEGRLGAAGGIGRGGAGGGGNGARWGDGARGRGRLVADTNVVDAEGAAAAGHIDAQPVSVPVKLAGMARLYSVKPELAAGWKTDPLVHFNIR